MLEPKLCSTCTHYDCVLQCVQQVQLQHVPPSFQSAMHGQRPANRGVGQRPPPTRKKRNHFIRHLAMYTLCEKKTFVHGYGGRHADAGPRRPRWLHPPPLELEGGQPRGCLRPMTESSPGLGHQNARLYPPWEQRQQGSGREVHAGARAAFLAGCATGCLIDSEHSQRRTLARDAFFSEDSPRQHHHIYPPWEQGQQGFSLPASIAPPAGGTDRLAGIDFNKKESLPASIAPPAGGTDQPPDGTAVPPPMVQ